MVVTAKVVDEFAYEDPDGNVWKVPAGAETNGASIPRFLWSIVGAPLSGNYVKSAVIHDHHCVVRERPWKDVHRAFFHGMLAGGEREDRAKLMYLGVYYRGPRWPQRAMERALRNCRSVTASDGTARKECSPGVTSTIAAKKSIPFPRASRAQLRNAPTARKVDDILSGLEGVEAVKDLSLDELEAMSDKAWGELRSARNETLSPLQ